MMMVDDDGASNGSIIGSFHVSLHFDIERQKFQVFPMLKGNNPIFVIFFESIVNNFHNTVFILFSETLNIPQTKSWVSQNNRKVKNEFE